MQTIDSAPGRSYRIRVKSWNGTGPVLAEAAQANNNIKTRRWRRSRACDEDSTWSWSWSRSAVRRHVRNFILIGINTKCRREERESERETERATLTNWRTDCMADIEQWDKKSAHTHTHEQLPADEIFTLAIINRLPRDIISMMELCLPCLSQFLSLSRSLFRSFALARSVVLFIYLFCYAVFVAALVGRVQCWNAHRTNWNCCDNNKNSTLGPRFCSSLSLSLPLPHLLGLAPLLPGWRLDWLCLPDWQLDVAKTLTDQAICSCKFISISFCCNDNSNNNNNRQRSSCSLGLRRLPLLLGNAAVFVVLLIGRCPGLAATTCRC